MPSTAPESAAPKPPADRFVDLFRAEVEALDLGDDTLAATVAERVSARAETLLADASGAELDPETAGSVVLSVLEEAASLVEEPPPAARSVERMTTRELLGEVLRRRPGRRGGSRVRR